MNGGYGPTWCEPFATWDPGSCSWRTSQPSLFEDLPESPPTWPKSGTWDLGAAYEHPMSAPATDGNASSSSPGLPTPMAADGGLSRGKLGGGGAGGFGLRDAVRDLLPTPEASDGTGGRVSAEMGGQRPSGSKRAVTVATAVSHLLKTPTAQLAVNGGSQHPDKRREGGHGPTLADQVECELTTTMSPDLSNGALRSPEDGTTPGDTAPAHPLLPTPAARDWRSGQSNLIGTNAWPLSEVVEMTLLPTPNTMDSLPARTREQVKARNRGNGDHGGSPRNLRETVVNELRGDLTSSPSADGSESLAVLLPGQLSLDGLENA
jgi:hypothetical protein